MFLQRGENPAREKKKLCVCHKEIKILLQFFTRSEVHGWYLILSEYKNLNIIMKKIITVGDVDMNTIGDIYF